jgi:hypothetical protein
MPNVLSKCSGAATSVAAISTNPVLATSPWTVLTNVLADDRLRLVEFRLPAAGYENVGTQGDGSGWRRGLDYREVPPKVELPAYRPGNVARGSLQPTLRVGK